MKPHKVRAANRFIDRVAFFLLSHPDTPLDIRAACVEVLMRPRDPDYLLPFSAARPEYRGPVSAGWYYWSLYIFCLYNPLVSGDQHRYRAAREYWTLYCSNPRTGRPYHLPPFPQD